MKHFWVTVVKGLERYVLYDCLKQLKDEKLNEVYYQPDHLPDFASGKIVRELQKITSMKIKMLTNKHFDKFIYHCQWNQNNSS